MVAYVSEVSEESSLLSSLVSHLSHLTRTSIHPSLTLHRKQRRPFDLSALHLGRSRAKLYLQHQISKRPHKKSQVITYSPLLLP